MTEPPLRIAVLISGSGTTLKNLIDKQSAGQLNVDFGLVISSRSGVGGLAIAESARIPNLVIARKSFESDQSFSDAYFQQLRQAKIDLVVMGGFLQLLLIPKDFDRRVINIHPSLIPAFCGKGFYGLKVHQAALDFGVKISGCTVHFVDNQYDHGPIILQKCCEIYESDTAESLQKRVFQLECEALPDAIRRLLYFRNLSN